MRVLQPTEKPRLNEPVGFIVLTLAIALGLSLISYQPFDPSWNVAGAAEPAGNLIGFPGAYASDILLQWLGMGAFLLPLYLAVLGWFWVRSVPFAMPLGRAAGALLLLLVISTGLSLTTGAAWRGTISRGGVLGSLTSEALRHLDAVGAHEQGVGDHGLRRLAVVALNLATHQQIEGLVGSSQFHIGAQCDRIVGLHERIQRHIRRRFYQ